MGGNYSRSAEQVCDPKDPGRKQFTMETDEGTVTLTVPNYLEDKTVRWLVDQGKSLVDAYTNAGIWSIIPETGMRPCVLDALRIKYFNPDTGEQLLTGGNFTCIEYHNCFVNYLQAFMEYPEDRGRIIIAPGVVAPSPDEEACIKGNFSVSRNLPQAYSECGASDILPSWEGAVQSISTTLTNYPQAQLYHLIKTLWFLQTQTPNHHHPPPHHHPPAHHHVAEKGKPWLLWVLVGAIALLLIVPDDAGL